MTRSSARSRFFAALSGIAHVILLFGGSAVIAGTSGPGRHSLDASTAEVAQFVADSDRAPVWVGEYLAILAYALFVVFAGYLWSAVRAEAAEADWERPTFFGAAIVYVALAAAAAAPLAAVFNRGGSPEDAARFLDLRTVLLMIAFVFFAVWLIGVGARIARTRALGAWLGWVAVVLGVLVLATTPLAAYDPGFTGLPTFASFLWIAVVSVMLARRERRAAAP